MKFYDSHTHLPIIDSGTKEHIVSATPDDWDTIVSIDSENKSRSIGIHPWCVTDNDTFNLTKLNDLLREHREINVGEIGLDYCNNRPNRAFQKQRFIEQLELAIEHNRIATIHTVRAWEDTVSIIERIGIPERGVIIHGFRGSSEIVKRLTRLNIFFSVGIREIYDISNRQKGAVRSIPIEKLLLETDGHRDDESLISVLSECLAINKDSLVENNNRLFENLFLLSR